LKNADPDAFIKTAIEMGERAVREALASGLPAVRGIGALDADQRLVYLIAEAEALCDMEGIDAFLNYYFPDWMEETAAAFAEVGAAEIAGALRGAIDADTIRDDRLLDRANELITGRAGYDYETIRQAVERRLAKRSP
jgi:hypothetical protein